MKSKEKKNGGKENKSKSTEQTTEDEETEHDADGSRKMSPVGPGDLLPNPLLRFSFSFKRIDEKNGKGNFTVF